MSSTGTENIAETASIFTVHQAKHILDFGIPGRYVGNSGSRDNDGKNNLNEDHDHTVGWVAIPIETATSEQSMISPFEAKQKSQKWFSRFLCCLFNNKSDVQASKQEGKVNVVFVDSTKQSKF